MSTTSQSLLDQIQADPGSLAWLRWHSIYEPLIRGWLHRHRLIPADSDDVVQEVFTVVVRRLPEFHHNGRVGAFRSWLKSVTINCLREHWKEQRQHPQSVPALSALDDWADERGTLSQLWDREHDRHLLHKLLALLQLDFAPETWAAFQQLVIDGRPAAEVASTLGVTVNAVYIAKSRVLTRLRQEAAGLVDESSSL